MLPHTHQAWLPSALTELDTEMCSRDFILGVRVAGLMISHSPSVEAAREQRFVTWCLSPSIQAGIDLTFHVAFKCHLHQQCSVFLSALPEASISLWTGRIMFWGAYTRFVVARSCRRRHTHTRTHGQKRAQKKKRLFGKIFLFHHNAKRTFWHTSVCTMNRWSQGNWMFPVYAPKEETVCETEGPCSFLSGFCIRLVNRLQLSKWPP